MTPDQARALHAKIVERVALINECIDNILDRLPFANGNKEFTTFVGSEVDRACEERNNLVDQMGDLEDIMIGHSENAAVFGLCDCHRCMTEMFQGRPRGRKLPDWCFPRRRKT